MSNETNTIQMKCQDCGGTLTVDKTRSILSCPYCGSTRMITESDEVKMERIRTEAYKDVEFKKQEMEAQKREQDKKNSLQACIILGVMSIIMFLIAFMCIVI